MVGRGSFFNRGVTDRLRQAELTEREPLTMAAQRQPVAPFDLVVFGGTGDLASRKLLPALYLRDRNGQVPAESRIIGAARMAMTTEQYRQHVAAALKAHLPAALLDKAAMAAFLARLTFVPLDASSTGLFEPLWNAAHVDHVEITVAETVGVAGRAAYYDATGALRDVGQNHLLQLLCLIALEPPRAIEANAVRDEKLKVLKSLKPIDNSNAVERTVGGQYQAGVVEGARVPGS